MDPMEVTVAEANPVDNGWGRLNGLETSTSYPPVDHGSASQAVEQVQDTFVDPNGNSSSTESEVDVEEGGTSAGVAGVRAGAGARPSSMAFCAAPVAGAAEGGGSGSTPKGLPAKRARRLKAGLPENFVTDFVTGGEDSEEENGGAGGGGLGLHASTSA
ncbi:unnamed protein product, partial [Discosporangium mesarthrocarpum]